MSAEFLEKRRKSLEDEFFHKENKKDLARFKEKLAKQTSKEELRKASGMEDDDVLDKLVEMGLTGETVTALSLVPLIKVAWADGTMQDNEREAILQGARGKGIDKDSAAFALLDGWLDEEPADSLFEAWATYVKALRGELTDDQNRTLRGQVTRFARAVAEAAGGFLGFGKVSKEEKTALAWIESIFDAEVSRPAPAAEDSEAEAEAADDSDEPAAEPDADADEDEGASDGDGEGDDEDARSSE